MIKRRWIFAMAVSIAVGTALLTGCGSDSASLGEVKTAEKEDKEEQKVQGAQEAQEDQTTPAEPAAPQEEEESTGKNNVFGEFATQTLSGEDADQEVFADAELTMVNIWGTFCGPCIREMPELGELSKEYADKGVQIVGIISDVNAPEDKDALEIIDATGADYTHLILSQDLYVNYLNRVQSVPTTVFLDKNGNQVGEVYSGIRNKEMWAQIIEETLGMVEA